MTCATPTWIKFLCIALVALPLAANTKPKAISMGVWETSDGREAMMHCPTEDLYRDRSIKLPKGCKTQAPGVWLSVSTHRALGAENARLKAKLENTEKALAELRAVLKSERLEISNYFKTTSSKLELIEKGLTQEKFSWASAGLGFAGGLTFCGGAWLGGSF